MLTTLGGLVTLGGGSLAAFGDSDMAPTGRLMLYGGVPMLVGALLWIALAPASVEQDSVFTQWEPGDGKIYYRGW